MPKLRDESNRQYIIWSVEWQHATVISPEDLLCIDDPPVDADEINEIFWSTPPKVGPVLDDEGNPVLDDEGNLIPHPGYEEPYNVEDDEARYREIVGA